MLAEILLPLRIDGKYHVLVFNPLYDTDIAESSQEASIADISYLFEEGDLVDFEIDGLVKLVRALFADTPLRTNTINKLVQGHPVSSS